MPFRDGRGRDPHHRCGFCGRRRRSSAGKFATVAYSAYQRRRHRLQAPNGPSRRAMSSRAAVRGTNISDRAGEQIYPHYQSQVRQSARHCRALRGSGLGRGPRRRSCDLPGRFDLIWVDASCRESAKVCVAGRLPRFVITSEAKQSRSTWTTLDFFASLAMTPVQACCAFLLVSLVTD